MPALLNKTYFNYGGQGPLPTPSLQAIMASWTTIQELGPFTAAAWSYVEQQTAQLRQRLGHWLGLPTHHLAFTENVTSGCVLPLWGLPWQPGDELLISDCEHPGVVAACHELARREGLTVATLPVLQQCLKVGQSALAEAVLAALEQALLPQTRLVVLSHLLWNTGAVMPIAAVAARLAEHPRSPWLLVDGAQSLGSIPVMEGARAADIYGCTGHKWCCGPEGLGVVGLSSRLVEQAQPTLIGWRSLRHEGKANSVFHPDARRFEVGTSCIPLMAGLDCSLQLLESQGSAQQRLDAIRQRSLQLWQGLQQLDAVHTLLPDPPPAGLVSFWCTSAERSAGDPNAVVQLLGSQGLWIRSLENPACLRACTHIVTEPGEIQRLLAALEGI